MDIPLGAEVVNVAGKTIIPGIVDIHAHWGSKSSVLDVEDFSVGIDQAIPCGIVINELLANSLKHAFPEGKHGTIEVKARMLGDEIEIVIADDGTGLSKDVDYKNANTLGLMLVEGIIEKQLHGTWNMSSGSSGTTHTMRFKKAK